MPIFEYACRECSHQFEVLVRASDTATACPACQGTALERRLSVFAAHTSAAAPSRQTSAPSPCGSCGDPRGPGACSMN